MIEEKARVARGVAILYLANVTTLLLNTLFLVLLANYYGTNQAEVGLVSFLNVVLVSATTVAVLALPVVGGGVVATPPAVTRFLSARGGQGGGGARRVYLLSAGICGAVSFCFVLLSAYSPIASLVAGPMESGAVFAACVDALVYSFAQLGAYTLLGMDRATYAGKAIIASSLLRYGFASVFLLMKMGPTGVFFGFAAGDLVLAALSGYACLPIIRKGDGGKGDMKPVVKYMVSVFFAALMGLAVSQTDKVLAYFQLGLGNLAVYNIATVGAAVASFAPAAATNVLVPALSGLGDDDTKTLEILRAYTRHISLSAIPIGFELAAVSPFLLRLFGDQYAGGAPVMAVIAISISFTAVTAVYSSTLLVDDRAHHFTLSNLLGLAALIGIAVLTVPTLGFLGIALGRGAMLFISFAAVAYFARKLGRLVLDARAYVKSLLASALMAGVVYALLCLASSFGLGRFTLVGASILMIPVGFSLYVLTMKLMRAYTEEDMDFIDSLLPSYLRRLSKLARKLL